MQASSIQLKLFASLTPMAPQNAERLSIESGVTVRKLLEDLGIPLVKAHLIFVDGVKRTLDHRLNGGERVGVFPPVAGG